MTLLVWPVLGISKVSALTKTTEPIKYRSGNDPSRESKYPGQTTYGAVTMERGITHDPEFRDWAEQVNPYGGDAKSDRVNQKTQYYIRIQE